MCKGKDEKGPIVRANEGAVLPPLVPPGQLPEHRYNDEVCYSVPVSVLKAIFGRANRIVDGEAPYNEDEARYLAGVIRRMQANGAVIVAAIGAVESGNIPEAKTILGIEGDF